MAPAAAEPARTSRRAGVFFDSKVKGLFPWGPIGFMFVAFSAATKRPFTGAHSCGHVVRNLKFNVAQNVACFNRASDRW